MSVCECGCLCVCLCVSLSECLCLCPSGSLNLCVAVCVCLCECVSLAVCMLFVCLYLSEWKCGCIRPSVCNKNPSNLHGGESFEWRFTLSNRGTATILFLFYKNNFIRTSRLKIAKILRTSSLDRNLLVLIKKKECTLLSLWKTNFGPTYYQNWPKWTKMTG